jgi:hypothetical protein
LTTRRDKDEILTAMPMPPPQKKSESSFAMAMMQMLSNETGSEKTNPLKTQAIFHICDYKMVLKVNYGQML